MSQDVDLTDTLLKTIPDFIYWEEALSWISEGQRIAQGFNLESIDQTSISFLEWREIEEARDPSLGLYASVHWRKFVLATFLADLISYPKPVDQVSFDRLLFVMHAFPRGFRIGWIKTQEGCWWPMGYTGWYPMLRTAYETFQHQPETLQDRMVVPHLLEEESPHLYLFNFSAAPQLKKTLLTQRLMKSYISDLEKQMAKGLACIAVSEDGERIAHRLGMLPRGYFNLQGEAERVYTSSQEKA